MIKSTKSQNQSDQSAASREIRDKAETASREKRETVSREIRDETPANNIRDDKIKPSRDIKFSLLTAGISATLRIAVPTLGLFFAGLVVDALRREMAYFAIIGAIIGFAIGVFLIYLQIKKLNAQEFAPDAKTDKSAKIAKSDNAKSAKSEKIAQSENSENSAKTEVER